MKLKRAATLSLFAFAAAMFTLGCDKGSDGDGQQTLSPADKVARGWQRFEAGEYTTALNLFREAIAENSRLSDAYNGAGWATGRTGGAPAAADGYFADAFRLDTTRYDALAGWAFTSYQLARWDVAVNKADSVLHRRSGWRFLHQTSVDFLDLRLMTAAAYFNLGNLAACRDLIVTYLNPSFEVDITTPEGQRELLEEIERLRRIHG